MSTVLYERTVSAPETEGRYKFCAKCGDPKTANRWFVHGECSSPTVPGAHRYCTVCGTRGPRNRSATSAMTASSASGPVFAPRWDAPKRLTFWGITTSHTTTVRSQSNGGIRCR